MLALEDALDEEEPRKPQLGKAIGHEKVEDSGDDEDKDDDDEGFEEAVAVFHVAAVTPSRSSFLRGPSGSGAGGWQV